MTWHTLVCCICLRDAFYPPPSGAARVPRLVASCGWHQEGSLRIVGSDSTASAWQWVSMSYISGLMLSCNVSNAVKELVCHHLDSCCSRTQTQAAWHWLPKEDLPRATDKHSSTSTYRIVFNAYEKWFKSYCLQCIVSHFNDYISSLRLRIRPSGLKNKFIFSTLEARSLKSKYWYSLVSS